MSDVISPFGFINALKPPGLSSTAFGFWVRRQLRVASIGHWGTLDPAACGVLVLAVGRAGRLLPFLASDDKSYVFEIRVGAATDTADATGHVIASADVPPDWSAKLGQTAASLVGPLDQVPPMYSAVKIQGKPLYKTARTGRTVERAARRIEIRSLRVLDVRGARARLLVECTAGTYVRTLCEQIGERLGVPAHLGMLLRTAAGPFRLSTSVTPAAIARDPGACLIDPLGVLAMTHAIVDGNGASRFLHGNTVPLSNVAVDLWSTAAAGNDDAPRHVLVLCNGRLLGVGRVGETLVPVRVLADIEENP